MKKILMIVSLFTLGAVCGQNDSKSTMPNKPIETKPQQDSMTSNMQISKESDMKTMDAVKTQEHNKITPKPKKAAKDSVDLQHTRGKQ